MTETLTPMIRPTWDFGLFHRERWLNKSVCAVICERDTIDLTKLCLESLLSFYPDLPIVIVEGGSSDGTVEYVNYLAKYYPNIFVWHRGGRNGHGTMLDEAIRFHIKSKYVLLLDSDIIVKRGSWIEEMLDWFEKRPELYALGSLMHVTLSGEGCGDPKDDSDILRYVHPSCSMINRMTYLTLRPFTEHGAPLVYNMTDAQNKGLKVYNFPIERYVAHLSGGSWTEPRTVWKDDMGVLTRPFFTFISKNSSDLDFLYRQTNKDFEIILAGDVADANIVIHNVGYFKPHNCLYPLRFKVHGEYICLIEGVCSNLHSEFINLAKRQIGNNHFVEEIKFGELKFVKRIVWQSRECLL